MDFHKQGILQETTVHSLEEYEDDDDDVFYDELRKQVLQLTADEDDGAYETKIINAIKARNQGPYHGLPQPICYYGWPGMKADCAAAATPAWMVNLWRSNANGTGVFIPQGVQTRRKNRSRRKNDKGRAYRRVEKMN
ncbi:hypothetical protein C2S52_020440 [Perilla frutescens var. hirtella]|uniref:Uncharacterized protein n=1 Tax=Perilla frutescens var. hirtella TaxID=608512 RepID=A0AAD4IVZ0_PERFH|nr:hypothetical protein C2S52_020440 [Perilla frutescens var. hirtella]KAH6805396.1 hypothetical protein C2S51_030227 [Perilla frutescens var. frutescens]KAH6822560.1 hypothetical protein C2S53_011468 [Perilla frutescens var. hirtella]